MKTNYKQLISILATGYVVIILMLVFENIGIGSIATIGEESGNSFQELQTEINKIPSNNWDPSAYSTLAAKIHTSKANGFITGDVEVDLQKKLDLYYLNKVIETTERYLHTSSGDYDKINKALSQLQRSVTISGDDKQKITVAINTLNAFNYYTSVLPNEIASFINRGVGSFDEIQCNNFVTKIDNLNGLLTPYSNNSKIQNIKQNSRAALLQFQSEYVSNQITW
jgi:hypothetical protein